MSQKLVLVKYPNEDQTRTTRGAKLVLVGDSSVGKSSIAVKFTSGFFRHAQERTIGPVIFQRSVRVDGIVVRLDIWDTAGQERFRSIGSLYYSKAEAAIVVYDITNRETFEQALSWVNDIRQASPNAVVALAGNKFDLSDRRMVFKEEAEAFAKENNLVFMETSAKTGLHIDELFLVISERLPKKRPKEHPKKEPRKQEPRTTESEEDGRLHNRQDQRRRKMFGCCWK